MALVCVLTQLVSTVTLAELGHNFPLNLADALSRQAKVAANLIQRAGQAIVETVAELNNLLLSNLESGQNLADIVVTQGSDNCLLGISCL